MRCGNDKGFTLIEIMIALAIVIVIGAVISLSLTDRLFASKIKADIQSTRVLRNALELYEAEQQELLSRVSPTEDFQKLISKNYIKNSAINSQAGGSWVYVGGQLYLLLDGSAGVAKAIEGLSNDDHGLLWTSGSPVGNEAG